MAEIEINNKRGIIFGIKPSGSVYFITNNKEHIWIENAKKIGEDPISKDIIIRSAKHYTLKGYNTIYRNIEAKYGYVKVMWLGLEYFKNKKCLAFDFSLY